MQNAYLQKKNKLESTVQSAPKEVKSTTPALPNSLLLAMHGGSSGNKGNPELENIMKSRLAAFHRQIPVAENEADKLSSGITSGTPEQVKQSMGERLGTDFSSVRFHTGESISQKADNIGARAWTQGNDVYFGEGGFHPTVAAHELVHTVQQGAVDSSAVNVSAPMGGVQMWQNPFSWMAHQWRVRRERRSRRQQRQQQQREEEGYMQNGISKYFDPTGTEVRNAQEYGDYNINEEYFDHSQELYRSKKDQIDKLKSMDISQNLVDSEAICDHYKSASSNTPIVLNRLCKVAFTTQRKFKGDVKSIQNSIIDPLAKLSKESTRENQKKLNMTEEDEEPVRILRDTILDNIKALENGDLGYNFKGIDNELKRIFLSNKMAGNLQAIDDMWISFPQILDRKKDKKLIKHLEKLYKEHMGGGIDAPRYIDSEAYADQYSPETEKYETANMRIAQAAEEKKMASDLAFTGPTEKKKKHR